MSGPDDPACCPSCADWEARGRPTLQGAAVGEPLRVDLGQAVVVLRDGLRHGWFRPTTARVRFGRGVDVEVRSNDAMWSRLQSQLDFVDGVVHVSDQRSACGTWLEGAGVASGKFDHVVLPVGAVVRFADAHVVVATTPPAGLPELTAAELSALP
ncbi:MAG: hypothetical protein KBG28_22870 [Kofleriaceae bacterium]|jgi:hypothetical protein|nr:hypothetical protein [Kofleriaceae bacterium]